MKQNKMLVLTALLFSTMFGLQAKDALAPKKYHLQELHFISDYKNSKAPKASDVYLTIEWRQKSGTHPKQTTDHTITPNKMTLIKSPGIGYYLQHIDLIPSAVMAAYAAGAVDVVGLAGAGAAQVALTTHHNPGNNTYFKITTGAIPKGAQENSVQIVGYKNNDAYKLANGIAIPLSKKAAKQAAVERRNNVPVMARTQVGPNVENNNQYPVASRTVAGPNNYLYNNNITPVATVANNNNNPVATRKQNKKEKRQNAASDRRNNKEKRHAQAASDVNYAVAN